MTGTEPHAWETVLMGPYHLFLVARAQQGDALNRAFRQ